MKYTEMFLKKVVEYCKTNSSRKELLGELAVLWSLFLRSGENKQAVQQEVVKIVEENFSLKIEGDDRICNYFYYAEAVLALGVIVDIDFLYFVRNFLREGLLISLRYCMGFRYGISAGTDMTYLVMRIIWCAQIARYDIRLQLQDFMGVYRKMAVHLKHLNIVEMEKLIASYSPLPDDEPLEKRFTVRQAIEEYCDTRPEHSREAALEYKQERFSNLPAEVLD